LHAINFFLANWQGSGLTFTPMFTMTESQIKRALRRNRRSGRRPRSLYEIAKMKGCARSMITTAVKNPHRYPSARAYIESLLVDHAVKTA
jgi:hypothetical protein